jgi:hypothetical protein
MATRQHLSNLHQHLQRPVSIIPLLVLRSGFGLMMLVSTLRFVLNGWVEDFYITPQFHFTYLGFGWVKPLSGDWMYLPFLLMLTFSITIILGWHYRLSMTGFFLAFTYVELLDKTYYLNHYYFVSLFSFLLIFLPLHRQFSLDSKRQPALRTNTVPIWTIRLIQCQLAIVYIYAGIAKLNPDWLIDGLPLTLWLPAKVEFPIIGAWFDQHWVALLMSWAGAFFDLTIPLWLWCRRTRLPAYFGVIVFHLLTGWLFPIGMFPYIMIVVTLIFFDEIDYARLLRMRLPKPEIPTAISKIPSRLLLGLLTIFFAIQLLFPLRHWLYAGNVLWTEEGFRFSWRVMVVEKTGLTVFTVYDKKSGESWIVFPNQYLAPQQERQMSFQPDMILQFAHFLEDEYQTHGHPDVAVTVEAYVSLNGRPSQHFIDPTTDLTQFHNSLAPKHWILPLN